MMTTSQAAHPSYLQLDRAALGDPSQELRAHLTDCSECRAYLEGLSDPPPESGLLELRRKVEQSRRAKLRKWWALVPAAAAAVGLLFVGLNGGSRRAVGEQPYIGAKGFASVWIYVKHGTRTQLWDGKRALFVGDQLRLKVDPGQFQRLEVYSTSNLAAPERLYAGEVSPGQSVTLPDAWELDDEPGPERLAVVLSHEVVVPSWPDWLAGKVQADVVVLPFELPKTRAATGADAGDGEP